MLPVLLIAISPVLIPTMAAKTSLPVDKDSNYSAACPKVQLQQTLDIEELNGLWFEYENNPEVVGYTCASYKHHVILPNRMESNFSCQMTNKPGLQKFPIEWELLNSTHPNASGISCFVYMGPIRQGPYYFIEISSKEYLVYSCNDKLEETLHIVARKEGYDKEKAYEKIRAAGVGHLLPNVVVSYNRNTCPED